MREYPSKAKEASRPEENNSEGIQSDPFDQVLEEARERNQQVRAETRQAAINLERLIQLVLGSNQIPEEFRPKLSETRPVIASTAEPFISAPLKPEDDNSNIFIAPAAPDLNPAEPMDPENLRPEDGGISLIYPPGKMLFEKGDPAEVFFVITEGRVSLFEPTTSYEMAVLGPGNSLGEQSILMGGVHSLSARALDKVVCTTVRADRLRSILDHQMGVVKPVFEAILLQLSMHNELRSQGTALRL